MSANKKAGTLYETLFIAESLSNGLDVSTTVGDYSQYDCIVDNGSKLHRVQIKGTQYKQTSGYSITTAMGARQSQKNLYADNAFDFLAALVISKGVRYWYIIPKEAIGSSISVKLYPNPTSKAKYEKFRHAWDLICS